MRDLTSQALLEDVQRWVAIESPTQDVGAVNRMADHAEAELRGLGAAIERIPGTDGLGDILLGRVPGKTGGAGMLVLGHMDTVHPVGTLAGPLPFRIEGERAHGPGIYDMKGGNAIAIAALKHLHATGRRPRLPVTVMVIPDEEAGSPSSRAQIESEALRHAMVLVAEPSGQGGRLTLARHGISRFHLRTIGQPAHADAYHEVGRSAIREMAHRVLAIEATTDYARTIVLKVGTITGGSHENMVPLGCEACVCVLVPTVEAEAQVHGRLLGLLSVNPDVRLEVRGGLFRPPYVKTPAIQALYDHAVAFARDMPFPVPGERAAGGGSDGNFTGCLGVPTLDGLGVIGDGPHTHEEHQLIPCLVPRTTLWVRLFETLGTPLVAAAQAPGSSVAM